MPMLMDVDDETPDEPAETQGAIQEPTIDNSDFTVSEPEEGARVEPSFSAVESAAESDAPAEEVLVINVMAPKAMRFAGNELLDVVLGCGMRFGDLNIFHRHLDESGGGPVLFSMANMVKPGVFDLNTMSAFETPGVSLFMSLPMKSELS